MDKKKTPQETERIFKAMTKAFVSGKPKPKTEKKKPKKK
jgi:hypothetical protein